MPCRTDRAIPTTRSTPAPSDQGDRAGARRDQVMGSEAHERVRSTGWREPLYRGDKAEQEVVDNEAPSEQCDDASDLVVDDRSKASADRAPEGRAGEPATASRSRWRIPSEYPFTCRRAASPSPPGATPRPHVSQGHRRPGRAPAGDRAPFGRDGNRLPRARHPSPTPHAAHSA